MALIDRPRAGTPAAAERPATGGLPPLLLAVDVACAAAVLAASGPRAAGVGIFTAALVASCALLGLYRARLGLALLDDLPFLLTAAVGSLGLSTVLDVLLDAVSVDGTLVLVLGAQTALVVAARAVAYAVVRRGRRSGRMAQRALIVGCGGLGAQLAGILGRHEHGLRPVGFIDDDPRLDAAQRPLPVLGRLADLARVAREQGVGVVVVGWSNAPEPVILDVLRGCHRLDVEIYTVPRFWQVQSTHRLVEVLDGVPLVRLRRSAFRATTWPLKRVVDVTASAAGLLLLGPLLLCCALAVRWEGGPGVLFRQERIGLDGRRFQLLKFRSMSPGTGEADTRWTIADDERVGRVGRWMRALSLDELPQLWNVLRGDMSLVGPRPERPYFVERFSRDHDEYLWRHRVPCGITGWAQVHGLRGDTSIGERARFDNYYIENWSLWLDVKILLRTVVQVLTAAGA
ncbi:sugar transferase [Kineococcus glutinatus]|uniref:Exopolysaccharide biosynthesis polyprenyl glycosylphosphotransferase n=1 Tax=Kineococcus glutinatus TaxID=1070872 RepID=A0ABP9HFV9_9ACTN